MRGPNAVVLAAILAVAALAGCGVAAPVSFEQPIAAPFMTYRIGDVMTAATGSPMVRWTGNVASLPAFQMIHPVHVQGTDRQPPGEGSYWLALYGYHGDCAGGRYVLVNPVFYEQQIGIVIDEQGSIPCAGAVLQVSGAYTGRVFQVPDAAGQQVFRPSEPVVIGGGYGARPTTWELVYGGRSGDTINVQYLEYVPAPFGAPPSLVQSQPLVYDIKQSRHLVHGGVEIEILDASNAKVTFRVLRDEASGAASMEHGAPPAHGSMSAR
ncbi:MAG TPA: hypothetical protein VGK20_16905 [Candidatus Binatia bacterium]